MIDVHAHVVLGGVMGCAGHYGPELGVGPEGRPRFRVGDYVLDGVDYAGSPFMDLDVRLALNDHLGIDLQVLSPNPITYFHHIEAEIAAGFCRWHNDELAVVVAAHPDRPRGVRPAPDAGHRRVRSSELRRAVEGCGLLGAYIGTDFGTDLDDPSARPALVDRRRTRRTGLHPPRTGGHRRARCTTRAAQVRPRPLARVPLRGDVGRSPA